MSKLKVCVLGFRGIPDVQGGIETHCQQLYPRLAKMGTQVAAFTRRNYVQRPLKKRWSGVRLINLWCPRSRSLEAIVHTALAVLWAGLLRPDIVHFHAIGPSLVVPLAKLLGLSVVVTHHGADYERAKWGKTAKAMLKLGEKWACTYADEVISISTGIRSRLLDKCGRVSHLVPNGVGIPAIASETSFVSKAGLTPGKYLLAVGRFVPEKGFHDLVAAFSSLETGDWKLAIAGRADHDSPYSKQLVRHSGSTPNVVLTGFIRGRALNQLYSHAGLFVMPSYHEGLPIALLEALGYGLSALASDIPANREVGLAEDRYFPVGNPRALAAKLECWMRKGPLAQEQRHQQIEAVRRRYNWDSVAEQVLEVYCHALGMAPPPPRESV